MVSATERKAGARVISAVAASVTACDRPGGSLVVDLRPCAVAGGAWALAELDVFAVEVEEEMGQRWAGDCPRFSSGWFFCGDFEHE